MDVLVGAGGVVERGDELAARFRPGRAKVLLPVAGKPMVQWVLDAIAASASLRRVFVAGLRSEEGLRCGEREVRCLPRERSLVASVQNGARAIRDAGADEDHALWVGGDLPLVRAEMLDWFVDQVRASDHDGYVAVVERDRMERRFPGAARTAVRFRDRQVCFGDVAAGRLQVVVEASHPLWTQMTQARKSPAKVAWSVGVWPLLRFASGRLTSTAALDVARCRFGVDIALIDCPWPEMAMDVDKVLQLDLVADELSARRTS